LVILFANNNLLKLHSASDISKKESAEEDVVFSKAREEAVKPREAVPAICEINVLRVVIDIAFVFKVNNVEDEIIKKPNVLEEFFAPGFQELTIVFFSAKMEVGYLRLYKMTAK